MECVTEASIFPFRIAPIKVISSIEKHSDRINECEKLHLNCCIGARREKDHTHFVGDWPSLISMFFYILKSKA